LEEKGKQINKQTMDSRMVAMAKAKIERIMSMGNASPDYPDFVYDKFDGNGVKTGADHAVSQVLAGATQRTDYGKTISLAIPNGFHSKVRACWQMYSDDALLRRLVHRCVEFAGNGVGWELKPNQGAINAKKMAKEKDFWNEWSARVNEDVDNVINGLDEVINWGLKHCILEGMAPYNWEWGYMKIGGKTYNVPTRFNIHSSLSVALDRKNSQFIEEDIWLRTQYQQAISDSSPVNIATDGGQWDKKGYIKLQQMGKRKNAVQEAFCLKYMWTPGSQTAYRYSSLPDVGIGLYPEPMLVGLIPVIKKKMMLRSSEISTIDGIVNALILWKIGSDKVELEAPGTNADGTLASKGTIGTIRDILFSQSDGDQRSLDPMTQLFVPWFVNFEMHIPDLQLLLNADKYFSITQEIFEAFGIFSLGGTSEQAGINISNFNHMKLLEIKYMYRHFYMNPFRKTFLANRAGNIRLI